MYFFILSAFYVFLQLHISHKCCISIRQILNLRSQRNSLFPNYFNFVTTLPRGFRKSVLGILALSIARRAVGRATARARPVVRSGLRPIAVQPAIIDGISVNGDSWTRSSTTTMDLPFSRTILPAASRTTLMNDVETFRHVQIGRWSTAYRRPGGYLRP